MIDREVIIPSFKLRHEANDWEGLLAVTRGELVKGSLGSQAALKQSICDSSFTPESGHREADLARQFCANYGRPCGDEQ